MVRLIGCDCKHTHTHTHTHKYTYSHTHTNTHINTHIPLSLSLSTLIKFVVSFTFLNAHRPVAPHSLLTLTNPQVCIPGVYLTCFYVYPQNLRVHSSNSNPLNSYVCNLGQSSLASYWIHVLCIHSKMSSTCTCTYMYII